MANSNFIASAPAAGCGEYVKEIAALADRGSAGFEIVALPKQILPKGAIVDEQHVAIISNGVGGEPKIVSLKTHLDEIRGKPVRREGRATATTLDSFIELANRHADKDSAVFVDADWRKPKLTAIFDYHRTRAEPGALARSEDGDDPFARFGKHRLEYAFPLSEPWKQWLANDLSAKDPPRWMDQGEFAAFLEDHIHELSSPNEAEIIDVKHRFHTTIAPASIVLDLARGLEVNVSGKYASKIRLQSGETQIRFETSHENPNGGAIDVPGAFIVQIPIFYEADVTRVIARLFYRPTSGGVMWGYRLVRPDEIVNSAVRSAVMTVREQTRLPTYDGAPEA